MHSKLKYLPLALNMALPMYLVSCASKPDYYQAMPASANPSQELESLNGEIESARQAQSDILAPRSFASAVSEKDKAVEKRSNNKDNEVVLDSIARARAYLRKASEVTALGKAGMENVIKARGEALTAKANESQKKDFEGAESDLRGYAEDIENGKLDVSVKDKTKLEATYKEIELAAITHNYLGSAEKNISVAKDEGAKKMSPNLLKSAEEKLEAAQELIKKSRYDQAAIAPLATQANAEADTLVKITRQAKISAKMSPEELALAAHQREGQIADLEQNSAEEQARLQTTNSRIQSLEGQQAVDGKVAEIRKQFSPEEADVLRDGNRVLIRLKNVAFKKNQSSINTDQLQVLSKVKTAVGTFEPQKVIVEGHTDSTGGKQANKALSEERAKLVQHYLETNSSLEANKIEAVGYGYEKPLATNKTAKGRAQNRRVDVVIEL